MTSETRAPAPDSGLERDEILEVRRRAHHAYLIAAFERRRASSDRRVENTVHVRTAENSELPTVYRLVHDAYVDEGYCQPQNDGQLRHYPHLDEIDDTAVFISEQGGTLVGTVSFTIDSSSHRLHTDQAFPEETDRERELCAAHGRTLAASWRIVTKPHCRGKMRVIRAMIATGLSHLEYLGADVMLCTFHPDHERHWKKILGMQTIAGPKVDSSVKGSPAILMRGEVPAMVKHYWDQYLRPAC